MKTICIKTKLKKEFIEEMQGDDLYLIYYLKAEDISRAYDVFNKSTLQIDLYYKECWKKYCEGREVLEELLDISRIDIVKL